MKIISDGLFFYVKVSDQLTHNVIDYFNSNQGDRITNIAEKSITRNGIVKFPLSCYPKWITQLQNFCLENNILLIWTNHIDNKGKGLKKLISLFSKDDAASDTTCIADLDKYLNL